jgi:hypothetical protein
MIGQEAGQTLILTAEDGLAGVIAPRLRACGADLEKVHVLDCRRDDGESAEIAPQDLDELADDLPGLKLIVIDPFADVLGTRNDRRRPDVRILLGQLARIAERRGIAIVLVNATDPVSTGRTWRHGVDVLPFLQAEARTVGTLEPDPAQAGRFLWLSARGNLAAARDGLAFTIDAESGKVGWDPEPVALRGEDLRPVNPRVTKVARAGDWLRSVLETGPRSAADVARDAALAGIARGALYEAKSRLGVVSAKQTDLADGGWVWSLPKNADGAGLSALRTFAMRLAADLRRSVDADAVGPGTEREAQIDDSLEDSKSSKVGARGGDTGGTERDEGARARAERRPALSRSG